MTASKTVAVPVERLFEAFLDAELREHWLPIALRVRTSAPARSARFDCEDGRTRIKVTFAGEGEGEGEGKSQVGVAHERLPDAQAAKDANEYLREHLVVLKALLEH